MTLYAYDGLPGREIHLARQRDYCWRLHNAGIELVYRLEMRGFDDPAHVASLWAPILSGHPTGPVQIGNEPNHPGEGYGGSGTEIAIRFNRYFVDVVTRLRALIPQFPFVFPGLAVAQNDIVWLDACPEAIAISDYLGCHVYWQYDNWDSSDWGRRYEAYIARSRGKPIIITEYGDSTPGRSAAEKAPIYCQWLRGLPEQVDRVFAFLASSPDPTWREFELPLEECRMIAAAEPAQEGPTMPTLTTDPEQWFNSPNYTPGRTQDIDLIIIHSTRGGAAIGVEAQATVNWFMSPNAQASAHALICQDGRLVHFVSDDDTAWGAGYLNPRALQVELEQPDVSTPFTDAQMRRVAEIVQWWASQHDITLDRTHVVGHDDTDQGKQCGKSDPGQMFDLAYFWRLVDGEPDPKQALIDRILADLDAVKGEVEQLRSM